MHFEKLVSAISFLTASASLANAAPSVAQASVGADLSPPDEASSNFPGTIDPAQPMSKQGGEVNPLARLNTRIENRLKNRITNRLDPNYTPIGNVSASYQNAINQARKTPGIHSPND